MLSGSTNTQSPISSVFSLPAHSVGLPSVSMATALAASSLSGGGLGSFHDSLFLSALPNMANDNISLPELKSESNGEYYV